MITRCAFWFGLVWFCAPHGVASPAPDAAGARMGAAVLERLVDLKKEIRDGSGSPAVAAAMRLGEDMRGTIALVAGGRSEMKMLARQFEVRSAARGERQ